MATDDQVAKLKRRMRIAREKRNPWEQPYQECYDYGLPGRTGFNTRTPGSSTAPEVYDETAVVGTQEFASRIQAGLIPNYTRWANLVAGPEVPDAQREATNQQLEAITDYVFEVLNNSNFSQEANEALIDIALGTACLECQEGDALNPVVFTAVPLPELLLDNGPDDSLDTVFRSRSVRMSMIEQAFPGAKVPSDLKPSSDDDDPLVHCVQSVYRDYSQLATEVNEYCVLLPEHDIIILEEKYVGIGSSPYIPFRWSKVAGEVWGRGPLLNTMPAVKTANMVVQMVLENAQMAIAGVYTAEDDGVVNVQNIRLVPGTVIPVAPGSAGLRAVAQAGDFNVSQLVLTDMRTNIKKALYNETLGAPTGTPMSATEVSQRMADLSRQIGSSFGRLQAEFVNRVLARVVFILKKQGRIEVPAINGHAVKIDADSPLSKAQNFEDITAVKQWLGDIGGTYGPQMVNLYTDGAQVTAYLQGKYGVPGKLARSDADRAKLTQQIATLSQSAPDGSQQGAPNGQGIGA